MVEVAIANHYSNKKNMMDKTYNTRVKVPITTDLDAVADTNSWNNDSISLNISGRDIDDDSGWNWSQKRRNS